jgi:CubicO group peptidase (beta-lactamase class C family)
MDSFVTRVFLALNLVFLNTSLYSQTVATNESETIQTEVEARRIAGGSHLVIHNGHIHRSTIGGYSDLDKKTPFNEKTIVRIYSMSKPITSVAAMILWEQGKFQLDDPVSKYIPAFRNMKVLARTENGFELVPPKRDLSVRDVFRHTTGYSYGGEASVKKYYEQENLKYHGPAGMFVPDMTIEQAAEALARIPALHHPGEYFTYGFSTDLLGRLIEVWSEQPLNEFMEQSIFQPLDMVDTGFKVPAEKRNRFSSCHTRNKNNLVVIDPSETSPFCNGFQFLSGGGGLVSTQSDYANFCTMLVNGGTFHEKQLLKEDTLKLMFEDQLKGITSPVFQFGLGFAINEITIGKDKQQRKALEYSWGGYASTDFRIVPSEKTVQIFLQQLVPSSHDLAHRQINAAYVELP